MHNATQLFLTAAAVTIQRYWQHVIIFIVTDKINNLQIALCLTLTQSTAKLLHKDNSRLRRTQHDNLIYRRNIYTFIQNINGEKIIELIYALFVAFQSFDKPCTLFLTGSTSQKGSSFAMLIKRL